MRVAIYARVSKALDQNPENQLLELRRWAAAAGHDVEGEYVDELSSKDTRPRKEEVLKKLRLGEVQGVAFWSLDRWGRSMGELVLELEEFSRSGISMFSMKEGLDLSTAAGRLMANVLAAMANFERDRIKERTLLGLARARAQGKKLGRPAHYICSGCGFPLAKCAAARKKGAIACCPDCNHGEKTPPANPVLFSEESSP